MPAELEFISCDVVIQAGHQNTPDSATGGESQFGKEIDWTPIVADEAVRILKAHGVDAVKLDASIKKASFKKRFRCKLAIFVHFDDPDSGESGPSVGYPEDKGNEDAAHAWKALYKEFFPFNTTWHADNFTSDLRGYYGYKYTFTEDAEFLIELGDLQSARQAAWLKPRLTWLGSLLAHFVSERIGKGGVPRPAPFTVDGAAPDAAPTPASSGYQPPSASAALVGAIPFGEGKEEPGKKYRKKFDQKDVGNSDPSLCRTLLQFSDGTVFFEAKMAIDADGSPRAETIDSPENASVDTSLTFPGGKPYNAETIPYFVLPMTKKSVSPDDFLGDFGLSLGDIGVVIYKDQITGAVLADLGPLSKIGESSIRTHERLAPAAPSPWKTPAKKKIRNSSIERGVLYFVFPKSKIPGLTPENAEEKIQEKALELFNEFKQKHS